MTELLCVDDRGHEGDEDQQVTGEVDQESQAETRSDGESVEEPVESLEVDGEEDDEAGDEEHDDGVEKGRGEVLDGGVGAEGEELRDHAHRQPRPPSREHAEVGLQDVGKRLAGLDEEEEGQEDVAHARVSHELNHESVFPWKFAEGRRRLFHYFGRGIGL